MKEGEKKLNPFTDLNPFEYQGLLMTINSNYQEELRRSLSPLLKRKLIGICLILPGSDGKQERHCQSKTEIVILAAEGDSALKIRDILVKLLKERSFSFEGDIYTGLPEIKLLLDNQDNYLSYAYGDLNLVYPDRVIHSTLFLGDKILHQRAKLKALEELKDQKIKKKLIEQLRSYRRAIETGFYRHQQIFNGEKGVQYYEENDEFKLLRLGFKSAFLRAVQRKLDLLTRKGLIFNRELEEKIKNRYLSGLSNTLERIEFLSALGLIPQEMAIPLIEAYYWFLQRYHEAQDQYKKTRQLVELPFDLEIFNKHQKTILDFLKI